MGTCHSTNPNVLTSAVVPAAVPEVIAWCELQQMLRNCEANAVGDSKIQVFLSQHTGFLAKEWHNMVDVQGDAVDNLMEELVKRGLHHSAFFVLCVPGAIDINTSALLTSEEQLANLLPLYRHLVRERGRSFLHITSANLASCMVNAFLVVGDWRSLKVLLTWHKLHVCFSSPSLLQRALHDSYTEQDKTDTLAVLHRLFDWTCNAPMDILAQAPLFADMLTFPTAFNDAMSTTFHVAYILRHLMWPLILQFAHRLTQAGVQPHGGWSVLEDTLQLAAVRGDITTLCELFAASLFPVSTWENIYRRQRCSPVAADWIRSKLAVGSDACVSIADRCRSPVDPGSVKSLSLSGASVSMRVRRNKALAITEVLMRQPLELDDIIVVNQHTHEVLAMFERKSSSDLSSSMKFAASQTSTDVSHPGDDHTVEERKSPPNATIPLHPQTTSTNIPLSAPLKCGTHITPQSHKRKKCYDEQSDNELCVDDEVEFVTSMCEVPRAEECEHDTFIISAAIATIAISL